MMDEEKMKRKLCFGFLSSVIIICCVMLILSNFQNDYMHAHLYPKYFIDFNFDGSDRILFDEKGVVMYDYGATSVGVQYNPTTISQYALFLYKEYYDTKNQRFKDQFLVQANWLVENARQKEKFSVWECKFDWEFYGMTSPFVSAMAQGEGVSVLIRAFNLSRNTKFLDVANSAINAFKVEMSLGGVKYTDNDGFAWFEEYADENAESSKVLNGFIFALFGLYESFEFNTEAQDLFWQGANTLISNLHRYDTGSWSRYDLVKCTATKDYHHLHIKQLEIIYAITGKQMFKEYSEKFHSYLSQTKDDVVP
jgi:heparosan-N-sulfate-glucuronate 5-epimerase